MFCIQYKILNIFKQFNTRNFIFYDTRFIRNEILFERVISREFITFQKTVIGLIRNEIYAVMQGISISRENPLFKIICCAIFIAGSRCCCL